MSPGWERRTPRSTHSCLMVGIRPEETVYIDHAGETIAVTLAGRSGRLNLVIEAPRAAEITRANAGHRRKGAKSPC